MCLYGLYACVWNILYCANIHKRVKLVWQMIQQHFLMCNSCPAFAEEAAISGLLLRALFNHDWMLRNRVF